MTEDNVPRLDDDDVMAMFSMSNNIIEKESETNFARPSLLSALTMHDTSQCIHKVMPFKKVALDVMITQPKQLAEILLQIASK
jgi:hypothetical protein